MPVTKTRAFRYELQCCNKKHKLSVSRKLRLYVHHHSDRDIKQWAKFVSLGGEWPPCLKVREKWPEIARTIRVIVLIAPALFNPQLSPVQFLLIQKAWLVMSWQSKLKVCLGALLYPHLWKSEVPSVTGAPAAQEAFRLLAETGLLD